MAENTALSRLHKALGSFLKGNEVEDERDSIESSDEVGELAKSVNLEERKCLEVMFEASPDISNVNKDAHGNWYTVDTVAKGYESYGNNEVSPNLFHMADTDAFTVVETLLLEEDTTYDNGVTVAKGSMLAWTHYGDDELWSIKKENKLGGLSPYFLGNINKETGEITDVAFSLEDYHKLKEEE